MLTATRTFFSKSSDSPNILNFLQHWSKPCSIFRSIYSSKRKISAKRDKDKKIFSFSKNLLNRNEIKRKTMGMWGYFVAAKAPRKFLRLSTRYYCVSFTRMGDSQNSDEGGEGTPKINPIEQ